MILELLPKTRKEAMSIGVPRFFTGVACKKGHLVHRVAANGQCSACSNEATKIRRNSNPEKYRTKWREYYYRNQATESQRLKNWIVENPEKYEERRSKYRSKPSVKASEMMSSSKWTARKLGLAHDLDYNWIKDRLARGTCEITGISFNLTPYPKGRSNPYTASLDRIIPEKGYVKSNVRIILWGLNAGFNSYGEDIYADIAMAYLIAKGRIPKPGNSALT